MSKVINFPSQKWQTVKNIPNLKDEELENLIEANKVNFELANYRDALCDAIGDALRKNGMKWLEAKRKMQDG